MYGVVVQRPRRGAICQELPRKRTKRSLEGGVDTTVRRLRQVGGEQATGPAGRWCLLRTLDGLSDHRVGENGLDAQAGKACQVQEQRFLVGRVDQVAPAEVDKNGLPHQLRCSGPMRSAMPGEV